MPPAKTRLASVTITRAISQPILMGVLVLLSLATSAVALTQDGTEYSKIESSKIGLSETGVARDQQSTKPRVIVTTSLLRDMVSRLCGNTVEIEALMGPGVDPHLYKVTPGDVRKLVSADLVVYHGLHLEGRMAEALENLGRKRKRTIAAAELIDAAQLRSSATGVADPHIWFDVALWGEVARLLSDRLAVEFPMHRDAILAAGNKLSTELKQLDAEVAREIATIPEPHRVLITAHDAFGYFGHRYKIVVRGVQGISTDSEAGLRHVQDLIDEIVARRLPAVFIETSVGERSVQALIDGASALKHPVVLAGPLYSDALGEAGSDAQDFNGMVRANVRMIVEALRGTK